MKIGIAQINPIVADIEGNVALCLAAVEELQKQHPDLIVFPEMAIPGCHPKDILFDQSFSEAVFMANKSLAEELEGSPPVIVGTLMPGVDPTEMHPGLLNAALLLQDGKTTLLAAKQILATHDVFMEPRWFLPGNQMKPQQICGKKTIVLIGDADLAIDLPEDLELIFVLAASPFRKEIFEKRFALTDINVPLVYVNLCGGNDEIIYDGRSFLRNQAGEFYGQLASFRPENRVVDMEKKVAVMKKGDPEEILFTALVTGLRDFFNKNKLSRAFLGVSGGIDSALVAVIAAEALGPENVTGVALPSRFSDPCSTQSAEELCLNLGIHFERLDIEPLHSAGETAFGDLLSEGNGAENIQARLRMMSLMAYVNRYGGVLLNTGNKTEASLGYATLYGDTAGTICPIGDLIKPEVYALAKFVNLEEEIIPQFIIDRKPTAELRPDQVDPFDYDLISPQLETLVQKNQSNLAMRNAEHKRWQSGVVLKVSEKAFGSGRLIPITRR